MCSTATIFCLWLSLNRWRIKCFFSSASQVSISPPRISRREFKRVILKVSSCARLLLAIYQMIILMTSSWIYCVKSNLKGHTKRENLKKKNCLHLIYPTIVTYIIIMTPNNCTLNKWRRESRVYSIVIDARSAENDGRVVQTRWADPPRMHGEYCRREQVPVSRQESVFLTW